MTARNSRADEIYLAATQIASLPERQAYVRHACKDDTELKLQVDALVAAHMQPTYSPMQPTYSPTPASRSANEAQTVDFTRFRSDPTEEQTGTIIVGRYKILERIGEGGMGMVFAAEQIAPVRRKVAL